MKTLNRIFIVSLILSSSLPAQVFKFGIVSSAIAYENDRSKTRLPNETAESSPKTGLFLALGYEIEILPFANLLLECNYEQERSLWDSYTTHTPYFHPSQHLRFDYLSFGVLPELRFEYTGFTIYSITGAQMKFELPWKYSYASDYSRKQLLQATLGCGLEFSFRSSAPLTIGTEIRFHPSILLLFTQGTATVTKNPSFEYMITIRKN